jgi:hypothetical protein
MKSKATTTPYGSHLIIWKRITPRIESRLLARRELRDLRADARSRERAVARGRGRSSRARRAKKGSDVFKGIVCAALLFLASIAAGYCWLVHFDGVAL